MNYFGQSKQKCIDALKLGSGASTNAEAFLKGKLFGFSILQWSGLEKDLETEKAKLGIEEIFRAKSCKLGSLTGREKEKVILVLSWAWLKQFGQWLRRVKGLDQLISMTKMSLHTVEKI